LPSRSHPCGETYLYFYSTELSSLLEGLHEAVSGLIAKENSGSRDDTSVISDLSELSGAIGSVVVLPQRLPDLGIVPKVRKSNSVLNLSEVRPNRVQTDLLMVPTSRSVSTSPQHRMLSHYRRKSMSETNLARLCLDETDEELDAKDDDLDDIRPADQPKDRTSSSGSYNSYRSTDSGVRLSASPSNYDPSAVRRLITKSDSIDSGVRSCLKDREHAVVVVNEGDDSHKNENQPPENKANTPNEKNSNSSLEEDINARVGAWCLQSAEARKSFFLKNLNATTIPSNREPKVLYKGLSRTLSESHKEPTDRSGVKEEYRRAMENPILATKHTTVYEEIKDVLKPLNEKRMEKEHEYEDLEKIRKDIKRSYSFQEKSQPPPPLPPRRPKSFSPDPWVGTVGKTGTLRKIFGLSFQNKSHSQDSMLEIENPHMREDRISGGIMASADVATVQALGTLPRPRRRTTMDIYERHQSFSCSPRMSPKQKMRNPFGISPSRSPRIPRPKNLFIFKSSNNDDNSSSPSAQAALRYQRQIMMQSQKTPSTDSSLVDISTPETPKVGSYKRGGYRSDSIHLETPEYGEDISNRDMNSSFSMKSPKIMSKTFSFLRKFPKDKYGSLERKRKSIIALAPNHESTDASSKVPNSFSLDSFAVDANEERMMDEETQREYMNLRDGRKGSIQIPPVSASIGIPNAQERSNSISPASTPSGIPLSSSLGRPDTPPATDLPLRNPTNRNQSSASKWSISSASSKSHGDNSEPQYANLGPDPDYMTVEEITGVFRKSSPTRVAAAPSVNDPGGYLSMGDIRQLKNMPEFHKISRPTEHEYMTMDDIQTTMYSDYPKVCGSATSSMDRRQTHHHHPHHNPYVSQLRHLHHPLDKSDSLGGRTNSSFETKEDRTASLSHAHKSAPGSRKTSCCDSGAAEYLTPQEVGRLLRRELLHTATSRSRQELERNKLHKSHVHK